MGARSLATAIMCLAALSAGAQPVDVEIGPDNRSLSLSLPESAFAREGNNVIIDDLLFKPEYLRDYADALQDIPTWLIGIRCSMATPRPSANTNPRARRPLGKHVLGLTARSTAQP
ncbi:MAG: chloramphenicol phosphotransferase CPT family protein [Planctomycetes bacterium]|nr:chloramphenicol phosphotransferase CPT family protein [Planctomycetota bacterium]